MAYKSTVRDEIDEASPVQGESGHFVIAAAIVIVLSGVTVFALLGALLGSMI